MILHGIQWLAHPELGLCQWKSAERHEVAARNVRHPVTGSDGVVPPRFSAFVPIPERPCGEMRLICGMTLPYRVRPMFLAVGHHDPHSGIGTKAMGAFSDQSLTNRHLYYGAQP